MKTIDSNSFDHLESLLPENKKSFTIKEVAKILIRSPQFVRDALNSGKIKGFALKGRSLNKEQSRFSYLIPRHNILVYLLQSSNYSFEWYRLTLCALLSKATKSQLEYFKEHIDKLLEKINNKPAKPLKNLGLK